MRELDRQLAEQRAGNDRLKARNEVRAAKMRALNFPEPPVVPPWCLIAHELRRYQARHGEKAVPAGWSACWGPVDPAHVSCRGMGGVNSSKAARTVSGNSKTSARARSWPLLNCE